MSQLEYYVVDVETTGLSEEENEVVQISIIRCSDRHQLNKMVKAEHPETANPRALKVTGMSIFDIQSGQDKERVVDFCDRFINEDGKNPEHRCFIAHNASFDRKFVHKLWEKCGKKFPGNIWMDTVPFTRKLAERKGLYKASVKLPNACKIAGFEPHGDSHDALFDTQQTYILWYKLMETDINHLDFIDRFPHNI